MKSPKSILVDLPAEKSVVVIFTDGETLVLKNFDPVDKSIYGTEDLVTAVLVEVVDSKKINFWKQCIGSGLQFSEFDVKRICDADANCVLFELENLNSPRQP
jgi:hypothetical protein